ncbi:hypothetical protein P2G88_16630 [Aliiglaciecola sp. CAU 1673]|uniref:hypothetical protein n=1 Tax=Aliiglaciecola sp. CAU 1673 TaxID=3032595 RepID=UPI0023DC0744|nr:hypothetical protein [Aliiglaciecola sp. CAU 1673]MDF2179880.1 hypothetical protein [Aliiglaciecola sp. CAU 1673]
MKTLQQLLFVAGLAGLSLTVQAHDPKEHMKDSEKPNCEAMKDMDHEKMDMNNPVHQAMMKKCMAQMHDMGEMKGMEGQDHSQHKDAAKEKSEHQH